MRVLASILLIAYGAANLFAGFLGGIVSGTLPPAVDVLLVVTGTLLVWAGAALLRGARPALKLAVIGLAAAFCLAVYNERVLGLGDPSHHLVRALYTALVLAAAFRAGRGRPVDAPAPH